MFCVFLFSTPASHSPLVLLGHCALPPPHGGSASRISPQSCQSHQKCHTYGRGILLTHTYEWVMSLISTSHYVHTHRSLLIYIGLFWLFWYTVCVFMCVRVCVCVRTRDIGLSWLFRGSLKEAYIHPKRVSLDTFDIPRSLWMYVGLFWHKLCSAALAQQQWNVNCPLTINVFEQFTLMSLSNVH